MYLGKHPHPRVGLTCHRHHVHPWALVAVAVAAALRDDGTEGWPKLPTEPQAPRLDRIASHKLEAGPKHRGWRNTFASHTTRRRNVFLDSSRAASDA